MIPDILFEELVETIHGKYPSITTRLNKRFLEVWIEGNDNGGAKRVLTHRFNICDFYGQDRLNILKRGISLMIEQFNKELEDN